MHKRTGIKPQLLNSFLIVIDTLLILAVFGILPFAWILRDGLGPDSTTTTGLAALIRTFMTFYIGPIILLLVAFDLFIRNRRPVPNTIKSKIFVIPVIVILILIALGAISFRLASIHQ